MLRTIATIIVIGAVVLFGLGCSPGLISNDCDVDDIGFKLLCRILNLL